MFGGVEAEFGKVVLGILWCDGLQNAYGNQVFRFGQALAHAHRPFEVFIVILWFPWFAACLRSIEHQWRIMDQSRGCEAFFQRRRINKGFKTRPRLTPGLGNPVELVAVEIESANQRIDRTVARVAGDESGFHLGKLAYLPDALFVFLQPYDGTGIDPLIQGYLASH